MVDSDVVTFQRESDFYERKYVNIYLFFEISVETEIQLVEPVHSRAKHEAAEMLVVREVV